MEKLVGFWWNLNFFRVLDEVWSYTRRNQEDETQWKSLQHFPKQATDARCFLLVYLHCLPSYIVGRSFSSTCGTADSDAFRLTDLVMVKWEWGECIQLVAKKQGMGNQVVRLWSAKTRLNLCELCLVHGVRCRLKRLQNHCESVCDSHTEGAMAKLKRFERPVDPRTWRPDNPPNLYKRC